MNLVRFLRFPRSLSSLFLWQTGSTEVVPTDRLIMRCSEEFIDFSRRVLRIVYTVNEPSLTSIIILGCCTRMPQALAESLRQKMYQIINQIYDIWYRNR